MKNDEKKNKIIEVAFNFFLEIGYEATTVRMICREVKIEPPTLYYYFKSKEGLYFEVVNSMVDEYKNLLDTFKIDSIKSPKDKLFNFYRLCIEYALNHQDETKFYIRYRMFKPKELEKKIEENMKVTNEHKKSLYFESLKLWIEEENLECNIDDAYFRFSNFIDNCTFNVIFSNWRPSDEEIIKVWELFSNNFLTRK